MPQEFTAELAGEDLLRSWLSLTAIIWSRRLVNGMTFNEAVVCNLLKYNQESASAERYTAADLCRLTNMKKSQMNLLLVSLEEQGYLSRTRSETDHRRIELSITPRGILAYHEAHSRASALLISVVGELGLEASSRLASDLNHVNAIAAEFLRHQSEEESQ